MGEHPTSPWIRELAAVWRRGWHVLAPVCATLLPAALGLPGGAAGAMPVLVVVAGSAMLAPRRFAGLCVTTLLCSTVFWSGAGDLVTVGRVLAQGALSFPFVVAGRAVFVARRRAGFARLATDSRLALSSRRGAFVQLDSSRSS